MEAAARPGQAFQQARGIVLFPHGGPHSAFPSLYDFPSAIFALLGLAVVKVNFRGSTGYGDRPLKDLPGKCGRLDVDDCIAALEAAQGLLARRALAAAAPASGAGEAAALKAAQALPVFLFGGSHGGFLVTHLSAQFPDRFAACVARNPVTNLLYTVLTSDIPDWCFVEAGLRFNPRYIPDMAAFQRLYEVSPIAALGRVRTPTMLMIGTGDRRVPPAQSYDYYRALQSMGVPARLLVYEGAQHGLDDKPVVHADSIVNSCLWFVEHGGRLAEAPPASAAAAAATSE